MDPILSGDYGSLWDALFPPDKLTLLNWNINRGLRLPEVMDFVRMRRPDLCIFQEVDLHAKRTGRRDVANVIASQFRFNYVFGIEFEELSQGTRTDRAFHGQAVFARSPILNARIIRFRRQSDFWQPRWFLPRWAAFQPRQGGRMALVAEVAFGRKTAVVYDLHLESRADDDLRMAQLAEVVDDTSRYPKDMPVVVAGDMNTRKSPSPLRRLLLSAGFRDAYEGSVRRATNPIGQTLDWIFVRGPVICADTTVHKNVTASDHYPVSTVLSTRT